jgi:hypothetical protein
VKLANTIAGMDEARLQLSLAVLGRVRAGAQARGGGQARREEVSEAGRSSMGEQVEQWHGAEEFDRLVELGRAVAEVLETEDPVERIAFAFRLAVNFDITGEGGAPLEEHEREPLESLIERRTIYAASLAWHSFLMGLSGIHGEERDADDEYIDEIAQEVGRAMLESTKLRSPVEALTALIAITVSHADTHHAYDQALSSGTVDEGDFMPDWLVVPFEEPGDFDARCEAAAKAALDAYYAPMAAEQ